MNGYVALRETAAWIDLSDRGKIRVTGEDRARLLHAMTTQHIQELPPDTGRYAFFLSDKGRILADAFVYNLGNALFLDTEPETRSKVFDHLDRFIIADDVTLEDESETLAEIGLEGPHSLEMAGQLGVPVGQEKLAICKKPGGFTVRVAASGGEGIRIFMPKDEREGLVNRLRGAGAEQATPEEVRIVRLENGVPRYGEEITERYLVQETQVQHAVHPNKGCYLGQEIVERVRARGQVHRLLTPIRIASETPPAAGTKLAASGGDVGEISSAVYSPAEGQVVGLAYIRTEAAHSKPEMSVAGSDPAVAATIR